MLKVRHDASGGVAGGEKHSVSEYTVHTRLFSPEYAKVRDVPASELRAGKGPSGSARNGPGAVSRTLRAGGGGRARPVPTSTPQPPVPRCRMVARVAGVHAR